MVTVQEIIKQSVDKGLISAQLLHSLIQKSKFENIIILDASFVLPGNKTCPYEQYIVQHIPKAVFFDIEDICDKMNPLPHMVPEKTQFEDAMTALGIASTDLVIVYGQTTTAMGPARAWWMLRYFGHEKVCVLDGGLPNWIEKGFETTGNISAPLINKSKYSAQIKNNLIATKASVCQAIDEEKSVILDARSHERFCGLQPEPRQGLLSGHIQSSRNIPANLLLDEKGLLRPDDQLKKIFFDIISERQENIIATCGSGITACMLALALYALNIRNVKVYDGSWAEWGQITNENTHN